MDYITGDKFIEIATHTYAPIIRHKDDYGCLVGNLKLSELENGAIIYTHTFYVESLFKLLQFTEKRVEVITHNSDMNIDDSFEIPNNVYRWYAQNVAVDNPRIVPIPIGLENDRWFRELRKKEVMQNVMKEPYSSSNKLVYMNFNISTNSPKRIIPYETLRGKPWVTTDMGSNGKRFGDYIRSVRNHKFVVCPEGNGLDTHRTWEAFYMGAIPIEIRNKNNSSFTGLPILLIDSWDELTEDFLNKKWWEMTSGEIEYNQEMLTFSYWKNKILAIYD